jgi:hypothetical protein
MTEEENKELSQLLSYQRTIRFGFLFMIIFNIFMMFYGAEKVGAGVNLIICSIGLIFLLYLLKENKKTFKHITEIFKKY